MSNKKKVESEEKKILSISLPTDLYQFLLEKTGKGNIGSFIREAIEEKIEKVGSVLVNAYKTLEESEVYGNMNFQKIWEEKTMKQENNVRPNQRKQKAN
jgi:predicted DNA-binding protein